MRFRKSLAVLALALSLIPATAFAQRGEADRLFNEGKRLFDAGQFPKACELLSQSDKLEPTIGTLGLLAACHERQGLWATAYREYLETARRADEAGDKRAQFARDRAAQLRSRVPSMRIQFTKPDPTVQVLRGGEVVPPEDYSRPVMLDPGNYEVVAKAAGGGNWSYSAVLNVGDQLIVVIPPTETFATGAAPGPGPGPDSGGPGPSAGGGPETPSPGLGGSLTVAPPDAGETVSPTRKALPFIVGGVGVVGLAVGSGFGLSARSKRDESNTEAICPLTAPTCPAREEAQSAATISTVAFILGGVGVTAGIVLFATTPKGRSADQGVSLRVAPTFGGAVARGTF